jgi:glutamine amidotransferase
LIAVVDYGAGNLRSVTNALAELGHQAKVTHRAADVLDAEAVIFPGVGAASYAMEDLRKHGLDRAMRQAVSDGQPVLAICVGMQVLFDSTEEDGGCRCLGIIPGVVKRLPNGLKTPHMGWNQVKQLNKHPIFDGIGDEEDFYFVHSYYAAPDIEESTIGTTEYGVSVCSVIAEGNLVATQFHPERSGASGLRIYQNFLRMVGVMTQLKTCEQKTIGCRERTAQIVDQYGGRAENLFSILYDIQSEYWFLPEDGVREVAKRMGLPLMQVYSFASFHREFRLEPNNKI